MEVIRSHPKYISIMVLFLIKHYLINNRTNLKIVVIVGYSQLTLKLGKELKLNLMRICKFLSISSVINIKIRRVHFIYSVATLH